MFERSPDLGVTLPSFQIWGKVEDFSEWLNISVIVGAITVVASFSSRALIWSRPVDLLVFRVDSCLMTDEISISLNWKVAWTWYGGLEAGVDRVYFCLIAFAKVIPILVKKLLKRDAIDLVSLCSIPLDIVELGADDGLLRDVISLRFFQRPEGFLLFSLIKFS